MDRENNRVRMPLRRPSSSIFEEGEDVVVTVEMPGVTKEGLEVRIEGNELSIHGQPAEDASSGTWLLRERRPGAFAKTFTLDDSVDRDSVGANLVNGVLTLRLRLKEAAKPRRVEIA